MAAKIKNHLYNISDGAVLLIILAFFAGAIFGSARSHALAGDANWWSWFDSFWQNFGTEMFGAFMTFLLIEVLRGGRQKREDKQEEERALKERLIRDMASDERVKAVSAVNELEAHGWGFWEDRSLIGARLYLANLQAAKLRGANLQEANLVLVNLQGAYLPLANLQEANLSGANLQEANLSGANLQRAILFPAKSQGADWTMVNLQKTNLSGADLQEATLSGANLQGANLKEAILEEARLVGASYMTCEQLRQAGTLRNAVLPDGRRLPGDRTWREVFGKWCETVNTDAEGYIQVDREKLMMTLRAIEVDILK